MSFDTTNIIKKVQYITIDSEFVFPINTTINGYQMGGNNNFSVNFGTTTSSIVKQSGNGIQNPSNLVTTNATTYSSNIFVQEMRNVIGFKIVDFYVTQIASFELGPGDNPTGDASAVKYIDILCPDIPDTAQILDERKSKIFARIPLERDFSGTSNIIVNDKQWKSFQRQTNYFNPISIKSLNFQLWEMQGTNTVGTPGAYVPLQPDATFYMILEVTTIDRDVMTLPKEDPTVKVVQAIQDLEDKFESLLEKLPEAIAAAIPKPEPTLFPLQLEAPPPKKEPEEPVKELNTAPLKQQADKKMYWILALLGLVILFLLNRN